jgi:hypothetical protein
VYVEKIRNIQHLQERVTLAIETVTRDVIQKTWQEVLVGKPEEKKALGRPRRKWENNIKTYLREVV